MAFADQSLSEFQETIELHIDALNSALEGIPRERVRLHCCWGNHESPHTHDVALADILPIISQAQSARSGAAFGNPRHQHEIAAVARVGLPDDMKLIAGVIDTTTNYVEHPEVVAARLTAAIAAMDDPGSGHRQPRLRLRHVRRLRARLARRRVGQAPSAARGRRPCGSTALARWPIRSSSAARSPARLRPSTTTRTCPTTRRRSAVPLSRRGARARRSCTSTRAATTARPHGSPATSSARST